MKPAEGALDDPASRDHFESLYGGVTLDDVDVDAEAGAVLDDFGAVTGVGPGLGDVRVRVGDPGEQVDAASVCDTAKPA